MEQKFHLKYIQTNTDIQLPQIGVDIHSYLYHSDLVSTTFDSQHRISTHQSP